MFSKTLQKALYVLAILCLHCSVAYAAKTTRIIASDTSVGVEAPPGPFISADGRIVAFKSLAKLAVNSKSDKKGSIYIHDRQTKQTTRHDIPSTLPAKIIPLGISSNGQLLAFFVDSVKRQVIVYNRQSKKITKINIAGANSVSFSADLRYVAFDSAATNLVPGDTNKVLDVFVYDSLLKKTQRVSVNSQGKQGNDQSGLLTVNISGDGRVVAFSSAASNFVAGDSHNLDLFVHDRISHKTTLIKGGGFGAPDMSTDGRYVAFKSREPLVKGDTNNSTDIFVHDRQTNKTERVSVTSKGGQVNGELGAHQLSADGRYVIFEFKGSNLVAAYTNSARDLIGFETYFPDIYSHDRKTHQTTLVSVGSFSKKDINRFASVSPSVSKDGRYVAFASESPYLVAGDSGRKMDVFVRDRLP